MRWCHIPIFQSESVITVTRTTVAVQAFQFLNISFCYTLFCFYLQLVNHPLRTLLSSPDAGRSSNLLSLPPWLLRTRAAAVASKPDIYTQPNRSYYGHDRVFVKQIEFNWNFLKLRWMPKEHFGSSSGDQPTSRFFKSLLLRIVQLSHFLEEWEGDLRLDAAKSRTDAGRLWTSTKHCRPPTSLQQLQATHLIIYPTPLDGNLHADD